MVSCELFGCFSAPDRASSIDKISWLEFVISLSRYI